MAQHKNKHKPLHFPTQRPDERVVLLLRRHWTVLARDITQLVASLVLPSLLITFLFWYSSFELIPGTPFFVLFLFGLSIYFLFAFLAYFHDFVDYHLDIWVVTDQRIVSVEQQGLFNRVISELNILKVQDVTSEISGKLQTFLDFGTVHIQTAGEQQRFVFFQVPHPARVAKIILQIHDHAVAMDEMEQAKQQATYEVEMQEQYRQQYNQNPQQPGQQRNMPAPPHGIQTNRDTQSGL